MSELEPILSLSAIDKSFPGVKALNQASLNVYPGEVMALIGENGAGKSTLMKVLTGIYQADSGNIIYQGKPAQFSGPRESQEAGISIIHQELNLISELSVAENIFLGREITHWGKIQWSQLYAQAEALLATLEVSFSAHEKVANLSIGQQQMVEIAKALSFASKVIIMDEPTDALTDKETKALHRIVARLRDEGRGIVYISHRLPEIFAICDKVTVLRDGAFVCEKSVAEITEAQLIEFMVGRTLTDQYPHVKIEAGEKVLEVKQLSGHGIEKASFSVRAGEIVGIFGLMGAGRTELVKMIYGALPAQSGSMMLQGKSIRCRTPREGLRHGMAYVSEDRKKDGLVLGMPVKENISLSALQQFVHHGKINLKEETKVAEQYRTQMNIRTPSVQKMVGLLSGGNQQKVAIAKGLLIEPIVLIIDEPTRGVDVGARKEIYQLLNVLKEKGIAIIMVSSDMPEILGMSDRILTLQKGRLTADFSREEATQEKLLQASIVTSQQATEIA